MERISKPHIVDLLRIFDKKRWIHPRILYASVRSKPELIKDILRYFFVYQREEILYFKLRESAEPSLSHIPQIAYNFEKKHYLFDRRPYDVPAESRKKVQFAISHVPVTLVFPQLSGDQPSTETIAVFSQGSP